MPVMITGQVWGVDVMYLEPSYLGTQCNTLQHTSSHWYSVFAVQVWNVMCSLDIDHCKHWKLWCWSIRSYKLTSHAIIQIYSWLAAFPWIVSSQAPSDQCLSWRSSDSRPFSVLLLLGSSKVVSISVAIISLIRMIIDTVSNLNNHLLYNSDD